MLFSEFFKGRFLYQDAQTGDLYYSISENPSDRVKVLPPLKEKRKAQDRRRTTDERKSLASRLVGWRHNAHTNDPLAAVRLPSFIIDDASIVTLAKFHPLDITMSQIRVVLDKTAAWEEEWSLRIFDVIQQFDKDLTDLCKTTANQTKNQQKRMKHTQDLASFEEATKENEERIRLQVLQRFAAQQSANNVRVLQQSTINNVLVHRSTE